MAITGTVFDEYRLPYNQQKADLHEHRLANYGLYEAFKEDTPNTLNAPLLAEMKKAQGQTTSYPVINRKDIKLLPFGFAAGDDMVWSSFSDFADRWNHIKYTKRIFIAYLNFSLGNNFLLIRICRLCQFDGWSWCSYPKTKPIHFSVFYCFNSIVCELFFLADVAR